MTVRTSNVGWPGGGHVRRATDADRILGQIERGEVRAGPDAAREIAARHQEAYGDVWADPNDLFADALATVITEKDTTTP
ncbi:hypothetical protein ACIOHE_39375 [Streptomyces sp. NPDC087851]|uniref:hypothetical protein n=1 Tax=Streptomyces sp. NPDC087851 TaxID=3365810 RepID=UPI00380CD1B8